jgi:hypothetical protein
VKQERGGCWTRKKAAIITIHPISFKNAFLKKRGEVGEKPGERLKR